jgi:arylsulfatase A-like enzyme
MTGQFGYHNGIVGHGGTAADLRLEGKNRDFRSRLSTSSLPAMLKSHGLYTVFIGGFGERHSAWWFYSGFREIYDTGKGGMESAEAVTPTVLDWIERNSSKDNWYLHVNYWDPHTPYRAPLDFGNPFAENPLPGWLSSEVLAKHIQLPGPHTAQDITMYDNRTDPRYPRQPGEVQDLASLRNLIDGYDTGIRYMDLHIGQLFEALRVKGIWDDLTIIISSDHGENFGELGIYAEHGTADYITCRVPLIIYWPGASAGMVDNGLHYNLDLIPTLNELLGGKTLPEWDGESFASTIRSGEESGREYLVLSQCTHVCQRSVRWGPWLFMKTWHDGFHLFPEKMVFDIDTDPHEQVNLVEKFPKVTQQGEKYLQEWTDYMQKTMPEGVTIDPMLTVLAEGGPFHARGRLKQYIQRLEESGRGQYIKDLMSLHPGEFSK